MLGPHAKRLGEGSHSKPGDSVLIVNFGYEYVGLIVFMHYNRYYLMECPLKITLGIYDCIAYWQLSIR